MNQLKPVFISLFQHLEKSEVAYVILRGFEELPYSYSNDLDFGVLEKDLHRFIETLQLIASAFNGEIQFRDLRFGVLKLTLKLSFDEVDIDIWTDFNFGGLKYLDHQQLITNCDYYNGFKVLTAENEVALSYLKELLHMNRLRKDKVATLQSKINENFQGPFQDYFNDKLIHFFKITIQEERFQLKKLSFKAKKQLLFSNIRKNGLLSTLKSIYTFFRVKINKVSYLEDWKKFKNKKLPNNILICSAGRRVSLTTYFKQEIQKHHGKAAKVFTTDLDPSISSACLISNGGFKVGRFADPGYMDHILSICKENNIQLVIPTIDTELLLLSENRARFLAEGIHLIVSDPPFVRICRDKRLMNQFFVEHGFKIPKTVNRHQPTFPLFIKPINGSSSQNIFLIKDASMLSDFHVKNEDLMFMEYLPSDRYEEYTIDLYYDKKGRLKCVVPRIRIAVRGGETNKGITRKNKLVDIVKNKLGIIEGARGCLTLQVFLDTQGEDIYGIEINPRFGGGYPLSYLAGANYPEWIIQEYLENKPIDWFDDWEDKLLLLRYDQEMILHDFDYK